MVFSVSRTRSIGHTSIFVPKVTGNSPLAAEVLVVVAENMADPAPARHTVCLRRGIATISIPGAKSHKAICVSSPPAAIREPFGVSGGASRVSTQASPEWSALRSPDVVPRRASARAVQSRRNRREDADAGTTSWSAAVAGVGTAVAEKRVGGFAIMGGCVHCALVWDLFLERADLLLI